MRKRSNQRRQLLLGIAALSLTLSAPVSAFAADWPSKPIKLIVAYGPGGNADLRARQLAQKLGPLLGQTIVVENKPGAGGNIGTDAVAKAAPDGYTLGIGSFAPLAVNKALMGKLPFDPIEDITPIIATDSGPLVLVVPVNSPFKTVGDLVKAAKAKPGKLTFASGGIGGSHHLSAELLKQTAGIDMIHVPYKGGSAAVTDLLGGNVDLMFEQMYSALPNIRAGKVKPLAVTSDHRVKLLPDVLTFVEQGYPKVVVTNWQGVIGPKGLPVAIVERLNTALNKVLAEPGFKQVVQEQANEVIGGKPAAFAELIRRESDKWAQVIKTGNVKP